MREIAKDLPEYDANPSKEKMEAVKNLIYSHLMKKDGIDLKAINK